MRASATTVGEERTPPNRWERLDRLTAPRVVAPLLFVVAALLSVWYAGRNLPFQDEGATLTAASRIMRGGVFYRDIDAYPFPGAAYLLAGAMTLFGEHLSVARALAGAAFSGWVIALYAVAVRLMGAPRAALFGAALLGFKFLAWPGFSVYMYSDLAFSLGCISIALLLTSRGVPGTSRLIGAGLCVAGAVAAKQNLGLYLGAAQVIVLLPHPVPFLVAGDRGLRPLAVFIASAAIPLALATSWFAAQGVLGQLLYSGLIRPLTGYWPTSGLAFAPMLAWWELGSLRDSAAASYFVLDYFQLLMVGRLPWASMYGLWWLLGEIFSRAVYTFVAIAAVGFLFQFVRVLRERDPDAESRQRLSFGLLALAILGSAFPRADFFHVISVAPPILLLLLVWAAGTDKSIRRPLLGFTVVMVFLIIAGSLALTQRSLLTHRVRLARADVVVAPDNAWMESLVEAVQDEVPEGTSFFVYGHEAQIYFLTGRFFEWPFTQLYPGQVGEAGGAEIVRLLESHPPRQIVRGRQFWPGMPRVREYAPRLERWIRAHYKRDPDVFDRHPLPAGAARPLPQWVSWLRWQGPGPSSSTREQAESGDQVVGSVEP